MPPNTSTRIADIGKPRIIVIGGGFGGLETINNLRGIDAQIILFDRQNHHTFSPLLYQVATSGLETNSIVFPFRKRFSHRSDVFFRLGEVTKINPDENCIETSIGTLNYDYLIIATGAATNFYGLENVKEHSLPLKTITHSIALRNRIIRNLEYALLTDDNEVMNSLMDYVIVGGGPTGVELAGALAELKKHVFPKDYKELDLRDMDIYLVEAGPRLLNGMSEVAGQKAKEYLENMGVKLLLNQSVTSYDGYSVELSSGDRIISQSMIWSAGVLGNPVTGTVDNSIVRGNRYLVDRYNRIKGYENIFAVGDVAKMEGDEAYPDGHPMMAQPAMQQGKMVAKNLKRLFRKKEMVPFSYKNLGNMATIGRNRAVCDFPKYKTQGFFAWYIWMFVHLIQLMGFKNKILTLVSWVTSYISYDRSNRLIIGRAEEKK